VDTRDLTERRGAALVDARCTGTAIRDFISVKDETAFDEDLVQSIYGPPARRGAAGLRQHPAGLGQLRARPLAGLACGRAFHMRAGRYRFRRAPG